MGKGRLILISHAPSKIRVILSSAVFIFAFGVAMPIFFHGLITRLIAPGNYNLRAIESYLVLILLTVVFVFAMGISLMQNSYRVYENGLTLMYPNFLNWLFHNNKKEGKFVRWEQMLGYVRLKSDEERAREKKDDGDVVTVFYWNYERFAISMEMFGEDLKDVDVVERELIKHGVRPAPRMCPGCGKKLLGFDYLYNRCENCRTEIFKLPDGAKIMPWVERHRKMKEMRRRKEMNIVPEIRTK